MKNWRFLLLPFVFTVSLPFFSYNLSFGQGAFGGTVGGVVIAIQGTHLQISSGLLRIDISQARFLSGIGAELPDSPASLIKVGTQILALLDSDPPDQSTPAKAIVVFVTFDNEGVLTGSLQAIDLANRSIIIFNRKVLVNEKTELVSSKGKTLQLENLKPGQSLSVGVQVTEAGLFATRVIQIKLVRRTVVNQ